MIVVPRKGFECYGCRKGKSRIKQFEMETMEYLKTQEDLAEWTLYDQSIPCREGDQRAFRPDVLWVLEDRYVILEIDEAEHKLNCTVAEEDRLFELRDELQNHGADKYLVVVRYNPNEAYKKLEQKHVALSENIREAFVTKDVVNAASGILKLYVGYTGQRKRTFDSEYTERLKAELKILKRS